MKGNKSNKPKTSSLSKPFQSFWNCQLIDSWLMMISNRFCHWGNMSTVSQYSDFMRRVGNWWFMLGFFSKEWRKETSCFCWCWLRILMKRPIVIMLHCVLHPWLHPQNSKCNLSFFQQIKIFLEPSSQDVLGTWGCWRQIFSEKTEIKKSLSTWFFVVWSDTHSGPTFYLVFILLLYLHKRFLSFMPLTRFSSR